MKLDLKQPELSIRNEYTLQLFDENNTLIQETKCHNEASSQAFTYRYILPKTYKDIYLYLGTGTGTVDTTTLPMKMFAKKFSSSSISSFKKINTAPSFEKNHYKTQISFAASTSYVGELTEVGLGYSATELISHALLVDVEDNPIIIHKTSTNILIVTIDIFISVKLIEQPYNFKYFPAWASILAGMNTDDSRYNLDSSLSNEVGGEYFPYTLLTKCSLSPYYCNLETDEQGILKYPAAASVHPYPGPSYTSWKPEIGLSWNSSQYAPISASTTNNRWDSDYNNFSFAHSIIFNNIGVIPLPNHEICPPYEYKNIIVGVGDGNKTTFLPYINEVVSAIGYVDGKETPSSFQNFDPRNSPLWNKCIKYIDYTKSSEEISIPSYRLSTANSSAATTITHCHYSIAPLSDLPHQSDTVLIQSSSAYIYYDENKITLDHIRIGGWVGYSSRGYPYASSYDDTPNVSLFYSDDEIDWTLAATVTQSYQFIYFDSVSAKYWKLKFSDAVLDDGFIATTSTAEQWEKNKFTSKGYDPKYIIVGNSQEFDFGKCGITFETPPPENAVITMDATLDLPYKDTDIIMTMSLEVEQPNPEEGAI